MNANNDRPIIQSHGYNGKEPTRICPHCGKEAVAPKSFQGKRVLCKNCKKDKNFGVSGTTLCDPDETLKLGTRNQLEQLLSQLKVSFGVLKIITMIQNLNPDTIFHWK